MHLYGSPGDLLHAAYGFFRPGLQRAVPSSASTPPYKMPVLHNICSNKGTCSIPQEQCGSTAPWASETRFGPADKQLSLAERTHYLASRSCLRLPNPDMHLCPLPARACCLPTAHLKPLGLGSSNLPHQPLAACPRGARNLRRQWTTAKPRGGDVSCNVLPFFLDLSLAFAPGVEFFDAVKSSVDSEVVFQATLQVRAQGICLFAVSAWAYGNCSARRTLQARSALTPHPLDIDCFHCSCCPMPMP